MNTRATSEEQAQANLQRYEVQREEKRLKRQDKMAINLPTQLLVKGMQPVEQFTGADEQDPVTWLQSIDELFDATKIAKADRRQYLPLYFNDDVKKWYRSEEHPEEYEQFKKKFIDAFTSSVQKLKISTKLMNRRQGNEESVQAYYYDVLALCHRFNPNMQDDEKLLYLLRGLKPSIQQHVIIHGPQQCKDLLEQAKRAEAAAALTQPSSSISTPTPNADPEETTAALRRTSFNPKDHRNQPRHLRTDRCAQSQQDYQYPNSTRSRQFPQRNSTQRRCYTCSGFGHFAYQCPSYLN